MGRGRLLKERGICLLIPARLPCALVGSLHDYAEPEVISRSDTFRRLVELDLKVTSAKR